MLLYFTFIRKEEQYRNYTLGFLFLAISMRIAKSIFYYVLSDVATIGVAAGFFGVAMIGPLAYFYFKFSTSNNNKLQVRDSIHLVFPLLGAGMILMGILRPKWIYIAGNISILIYLSIAYFHFFKEATFINKSLEKWNRFLLGNLAILALIFEGQLHGGSMQAYVIGTALASIIVYALFFFVLKHPVSQRVKKESKRISKEIKEKIIRAIEQEKIYLESSITLNEFAKKVAIPSYLVSKAVKAIYKKSFPEVMNSFRVKEIIAALENPENEDYKIEYLAYKSGFNTPSSFYSAFKKITSMSPREYQRQVIEQ
jgi:AraC-like DNA-binding protein